MIRKPFVFLALMFMASAKLAVAVPPATVPLSAELLAKNPIDLMPADPVAAMIFRDNSESTPPASAGWKDGVLRVECFNRPKSPDWVDVKYMIREPFKKGDVLLARLSARVEYAKQESGEAAFQIAIQQTKPQFTRHLFLPLTAGPDWAQIDLPFVAAADSDPTIGEIHLSFGFIPQAVEISGIQVLNFGKSVTPAELPQTKFTYRGREEGAAWRKAALERIEKIRTAPIDVRVIDTNGQPIPNASVEVKLVKPAFFWCSSVDAALIVADTDEAKKYKQVLGEMFDTAVIENGMKWPKWSGSFASRQQALAAADILEGMGLRMRGHCLVWPGDKFSPKRIQTMPAPRAELPTLIKEHIRDLVTATRGRMISWDVVNEMTHEKDYFKYMPETDAVEWYKIARECDPNVQLVFNDYGMLNGRKSPEQIATFVGLAKKLMAAGAPIDVLGIQGHVGRQVRSPEEVLSDLDLLDEAGLKLQITEFDVNTPDEQLQADYERDFLIAFYSHPSASGFTKWGFWEGRHWKPDAGMYRRDWSEKPSAKVWRDLVRGQWLTNVTTTTDASGKLSTRGHLGDYQFTVKAGDKIAQQVRTISNSGMSLTIQIP